MHGDFSDFAAFADRVPVDVQGRTAREAREAHSIVARYVLWFLRGALLGDSAARASAQRSSERNSLGEGLVRMRTWPAVRVPSEEDFVSIVARLGEDAARRVYREAARRYPDVDVIDQPTLNRLGYGLLEQGRAGVAVRVFRLNVEAHPRSADAYDSLAEGLLAAGDRGGARRAYEELLRVVPADPALDQAAQEGYRRATEEKLRAIPPPATRP